MSKDSEVYLGVDVSKESVDIGALSAEGRVLSRKQRVPRTAAIEPERFGGLGSNRRIGKGPGAGSRSGRRWRGG